MSFANSTSCRRKIQDYGVFVQKWPTVLGCDVAGEVVEVGDAVKHVKKGDRVMGYASLYLV